eukprot:g7009.t1
MVLTQGDANDEQQLVLSLWDYGGQKVFYALHHLFLTPHGGYVLVFNMEHLCDDCPQKDLALRGLDFWLRSLHMHAKGAPIFLVGTRADVVSVEKQREISKLLNFELSSPGHCGAGGKKPHAKSIQQPPQGGLPDREHILFYPVNNCQWKRDAGVQLLRHRIDTALAEQPHVTKPIPRTWLRVFDELTRLSSEDGDPARRYVSRGKVKELALHFDVSQGTVEPEVDAMLALFHNMGQFVHYNDADLRELVVLNPQWLLDVMSRIIRVHDTTRNRALYASTPDVIECHRKVVDAKCEKEFPRQWPEFVGASLSEHEQHISGVLDRRIAAMLWEAETEDSTTITTELLLAFMQKFDLLVQVQSGEVCKYLVPSLLPPRPDAHGSMSRADAAADACPLIFYLIFQSDGTNLYGGGHGVGRMRRLDEPELTDGFMPDGIFARLLAKVVHWSQQTGYGSTNWSQQYFEDYASVFLCADPRNFGLHFEMEVVRTDPNKPLSAPCLRVSVQQKMAGPIVVGTLTTLVDTIKRECMPNLEYHVAAEVPESGAHGGCTGVLGLQTLCDPDVEWIQCLDHGRSIPKCDLQMVKDEYWHPSERFEQCEIVLSHCRETDAKFSQQLWQRLVCHEFDGRRLAVSFDRLPPGEQPGDRMLNTIDLAAVFAPVLSCSALEHIGRNIKRGEVDWVLMGWMYALHVANKRGDDFRVYPLIHGADSRGNRAAQAPRLQEAVLEKDYFAAVTDGWGDGRATVDALRRLRPDREGDAPLEVTLPRDIIRQLLDRHNQNAESRAEGGAVSEVRGGGGDWGQVTRVSTLLVESVKKVCEQASQRSSDSAGTSCSKKWHGSMSGREGIVSCQVVSEVQRAGGLCTICHNAQGDGWFDTWKRKLYQAEGAIVIFSDKYRNGEGRGFTKPLQEEAGAILRLREERKKTGRTFKLFIFDPDQHAPAEIRTNIQDKAEIMGNISKWEAFVKDNLTPKEGPLKKKGARLGLWDTRWFKICDHNLQYVHMAKDKRPREEEPRGIIDLRNTTVCTVDDKRLTLSAGSEPELVIKLRLQADTKEVAESWAFSLNAIIEKYTDARSAASTHSLEAFAPRKSTLFELTRKDSATSSTSLSSSSSGMDGVASAMRADQAAATTVAASMSVLDWLRDCVQVGDAAQTYADALAAEGFDAPGSWVDLPADDSEYLAGLGIKRGHILRILRHVASAK